MGWGELGVSSQSTGVSSLHHTANSHWLSVLHMVIFMFQCCSLHSAHPLLPPLCPVCSLCSCRGLFQCKFKITDISAFCITTLTNLRPMGGTFFLGHLALSHFLNKRKCDPPWLIGTHILSKRGYCPKLREVEQPDKVTQ